MVVSGAELVMEADPRHLTGSVTLHPTRPLSKAETAQALEKALSEQAGIVIERIDDKRVSVTRKRRTLREK